MLLLFSAVLCAAAVFSYDHAGSFDRLLAVIKPESSECMCEQMTHACSHDFFLFFLTIAFLQARSFPTELAPESNNKVVSIATQKQVTDSQ